MPHAAVSPLIDRFLLDAQPPDRAAALRRIDRLAAFLGGKFRAPVFGVAFGYGSPIGLVPGVGDVFDLLFKANRRNVALLRAHLAKEDAAHAPR